MLPTPNKRSSKLTNKILKHKVSSPKSVTAYIKELKEAENLEKKHEDSSLLEGLKEDPTELNNILNALKSTPKGNVTYLPSSERIDALEEICDFKNVGNLSNISFAEENSFREMPSEDDINRENDSDLELDNINRYSRPDVERVLEDDSEECWDLNVLGLELLMEQLQLEQERISATQTRRLRVRDGYLQRLLQIRGTALHDHCMAVSEARQLRLEEQKRLEQMELQADLEIKLMEKTYWEWSHRRKLELEEELAKNALDELEEKQQQPENEEEAAQQGKTTQEEEEQEQEEEEEEEEDEDEEQEENSSAGFINEFQSSLAVFKEKLLSVQARAEHQPQGSELHHIVFEELPSVLVACERAASGVSSTVPGDCDRLAYAHKVLLDIDAVLQGSRHSTEEGQTSPTKGTEETVPQPRPTQPSQPIQLLQPTKTPQPIQPIQPIQPAQVIQPVSAPELSPQEEPASPSEEEPSMGSALPSYTEAAELMVRELRAKWEAVSHEADATRNNAHLRPLLSRVVGVVNTLNSERHDASNRGKLQQLLNLLAGRICTIGEESVSTKGNPSAQAFVREQLASRLVTLAHDKQAASMGVYASLVVRLWQLHPPVGELILFHLLEACPFLAPRGIRRLPGQTDAQFHQSLGFRQSEGGPREPVDKYLTRMAHLAQLYGRIVAMEVEGEHPHGLHNGWSWMARTLCLPPYPSVTAALLRGFLGIAGARLLAHYGRQFRKMLGYLAAQYLPQIEEDTLEGGRADISALKSLLRDYDKMGILPTLPDGYKLLL